MHKVKSPELKKTAVLQLKFLKLFFETITLFNLESVR